MMIRTAIALSALSVAAATPAAARDLPVPADKGWQHAATGLILPARLDGLPRTKLIDQTDSEHDVLAEFADADTVATIYVFHPAIDNVAMWFERAETQIYNRALFGDVAPNTADPIAFAPPRSMVTSALRRVYTAGKGGFHTTGLAMMPLGDWLVAIRISGRTLSPSTIDAKLSAVIAAMRWPAGVAPSPVPAMIGVCTAPLVFAKAKQQKPQGSDMLMSLLAGAIAADPNAKARPAEPARWCRDPATTPQYGVYRNLSFDKGYTLALADAGRVMHVSPTLDAQIGKGDGYSVSFTNVDGTTSSYPGFDHLPAPPQVIAVLGGPATGRAAGKTITVDVNRLGK